MSTPGSLSAKRLSVKVLSGVVESLSFLSPVGVIDIEEGMAWPVQVAVGFTAVGGGSVHGTVIIALADGTAAHVARNMAGMDFGEEPDAETAGEAAKELANVVVGNLLPVLFGANHEYQLAAPELVPSRPLAGDLVVGVALDEGAIAIAVEAT